MSYMTSSLPECKGNFLFRSQAEGATIFSEDLKILDSFLELPGGAVSHARPLSTSSERKIVRGGLVSAV